MSGGAATSVALPQAAKPGRSTRGSSLRRSIAGRRLDPVVVQLIAFAALSAFVAARWIALVAHPPGGRAALAVATLTAGGTALVWLGRRARRLATWAAGLGVTILATVVAALAMGLPGRLLAPARWGDLGHDLGNSFQGLGALAYPYQGGDEWSRLVILLGLPVAVGLSAALAFWPARRAAPLLRAGALIVLLVTYGVGVTVSPPGAPLLQGLILLMLVAAWLWLPALGRREALTGGALVLAAGLLSLPVSAQLDRHHPWLDYRNWDWSWSGVQTGESFDWNHSYGPLNWTRTGKTLLEVKSNQPHYWRTVTLDQFDGYRWLQSTATSNAAVELPHSPTNSPFTPQTVRLNPKWVHSLTFTIRDLSSQLVVGAGTPLALVGIDGVAPIQGGLAVPPDQSLGAGDSYTLRAYVPEPSSSQMRRASGRYPHVLAPYTQVVLPHRQTLAPGDNPGAPNQNSTPSTRISFGEVTVPFWGSPGGRRASQLLGASVYGGVYRLARRVTAGAATPYRAVQDLERYLRSSYSYSEIPPQRQVPLRAFLLKDGIGYCQQFSGAMALMLRMVGIPARVASGFSPGTTGQAGTYVVRDFDAHSWVEVYFNGIGWVTFDPTPAAAPARSRTSGLGAHRPSLPPTGRPLPAQPGGDLVLRRSGQPGGGSGISPLWLAPLAVALAALGALGAFGARTARSRSLSRADLAEALLRELDLALARLRSRAGAGTTLLALERRLGIVAGPASASYAARLRGARYEPGEHPLPGTAERRALRRELSAGLGFRGRLRGLLAIPPGGPARLRSSG